MFDFNTAISYSADSKTALEIACSLLISTILSQSSQIFSIVLRDLASMEHERNSVLAVFATAGPYKIQDITTCITILLVN